MPDAAQSVKFKLRTSVLNQQAEVIDEHRTVLVQDGVLQDHFAPYESHLYRLEIAHVSVE
jgi:hypothetical protein